MSDASYTLFSTAIGPCGIAWTDAGIVAFQLPEGSEDRTRARLVSRTGDARRAPRPPAWIRDAVRAAQKHLGGDAQDMTALRLDYAGLPAFHVRVYEALRKVAPNQTVTYAELARLAGSPAAVRAVGQAMAKNPIPLIVPCHRVLAANGKGGFSAYGGTATKAKLLAAEGVVLGARKERVSPSDAPLFDAAHLGAPALPYDAAEAVRHLSSQDERLADLILRAGPYTMRLKETEGAFAALAEAIVYQQLNGKAAATILGRVKALFAPSFTARDILAAKDAALRGAGLSRSKLLALRDLAEKSESGVVPTLPQLATMTDDAIVEHLTQVRGIGRWTVEMLLMFRLGRADVLPVTDYGIRQGFKLTFRTRDLPDAKKIEKRAESWRPFRSVASWYLWRAVDLAKAKAAENAP